MQMRAPAVPLITVDPYFSVWSPADRLTDCDTEHWSGRRNTIRGYATVDGVEYRFMGTDNSVPPMKQTSLEIGALSSVYTFEAAGIGLTAIFTTPLLTDELDIMTRPVSYLELLTSPLDGDEHSVMLRITASEELCLDRAGDDVVDTDKIITDEGITLMEMGSRAQKVLDRAGDDVRIGWGYFYLGARGAEVSASRHEDGMTYVSAELCTDGDSLFFFAYDDISSIDYFGKHLTSVWNRDGMSIAEAVDRADAEYSDIISRCDTFSDRMFIQGVRAGGEKYAELLHLAYRQAIAAHKCVLDGDRLLFISKECYSNGCAATVDVSYPSIPLFLLYNPELVKGMMRPILDFARNGGWEFDFAPHDCGTYPLVEGQVYNSADIDGQMPVEECGNMLIMAAAVCAAEKDTAFARENLDLFEEWVKYLIDNGADPSNQLCTDDFAGHMPHNCNLSVKAVMGIAGLAIIYDMMDDRVKSDEYMEIARNMADSWGLRAANPDGSYRLAFDREDSWSIKYNMVWDKLFGTGLFAPCVVTAEAYSELNRMNAYGIPLDCRATYTKSDWLIWAGTLLPLRNDFEKVSESLWAAFDSMPERVPMTDWYDTVTSEQVVYKHRPDKHPVGFRNRSVIGGLFIKLLEYSGKMRIDMMHMYMPDF